MMQNIPDLTDKLNNVDARVISLNEINVDATAAVRQLIRYLLDVLVALDVAESHTRVEAAKDEPSIERLKEIEDRFFSRLAILQATRATYNGY